MMPYVETSEKPEDYSPTHETLTEHMEALDSKERLDVLKSATKWALTNKDGEIRDLPLGEKLGALSTASEIAQHRIDEPTGEGIPTIYQTHLSFEEIEETEQGDSSPTPKPTSTRLVINMNNSEDPEDTTVIVVVCDTNNGGNALLNKNAFYEIMTQSEFEAASFEKRNIGYDIPDQMPEWEKEIRKSKTQHRPADTTKQPPAFRVSDFRDSAQSTYEKALENFNNAPAGEREKLRKELQRAEKDVERAKYVERVSREKANNRLRNALLTGTISRRQYEEQFQFTNGITIQEHQRNIDAEALNHENRAEAKAAHKDAIEAMFGEGYQTTLETGLSEIQEALGLTENALDATRGRNAEQNKILRTTVGEMVLGEMISRFDAMNNPSAEDLQKFNATAIDLINIGRVANIDPSRFVEKFKKERGHEIPYKPPEKKNPSSKKGAEYLEQLRLDLTDKAEQDKTVAQEQHELKQEEIAKKTAERRARLEADLDNLTSESNAILIELDATWKGKELNDKNIYKYLAELAAKAKERGLPRQETSRLRKALLAEYDRSLQSLETLEQGEEGEKRKESLKKVTDSIAQIPELPKNTREYIEAVKESTDMLPENTPRDHRIYIERKLPEAAESLLLEAHFQRAMAHAQEALDQLPGEHTDKDYAKQARKFSRSSGLTGAQAREIENRVLQAQIQREKDKKDHLEYLRQVGLEKLEDITGTARAEVLEMTPEEARDRILEDSSMSREITNRVSTQIFNEMIQEEAEVSDIAQIWQFMMENRQKPMDQEVIATITEIGNDRDNEQDSTLQAEKQILHRYLTDTVTRKQLLGEPLKAEDVRLMWEAGIEETPTLNNLRDFEGLWYGKGTEYLGVTREELENMQPDQLDEALSLHYLPEHSTEIRTLMVETVNQTPIQTNAERIQRWIETNGRIERNWSPGITLALDRGDAYIKYALDKRIREPVKSRFEEYLLRIKLQRGLQDTFPRGTEITAELNRIVAEETAGINNSQEDL